jgi:hypothetical protein
VVGDFVLILLIDITHIFKFANKKEEAERGRKTKKGAKGGTRGRAERCRGRGPNRGAKRGVDRFGS